MSSHHSQLLTCTYLPMGIYFYFLCLSLSPDINLDVNLEDDHLIPFMKYSSTTSCFHCRLFFFVCLSFFSCISNLYISMFKSHYLHITLINLSMLPPARPHNTDNDSNDNNNAKVYISNINKNIDEYTFKKKFEQFGPIRSCILKKKPNDVTYSFIEYERAADAVQVIAKLNGTEVWDRNLKVEFGLGGKKGFQHYLTDAERDRKFGQRRLKRQDSEENRDLHSRIRQDYKNYERRRQDSREHRKNRSYSPPIRKQHRKKQSPRRDHYRSSRRDSRERMRSYSYDSRDSRDHQYREKRERRYRERERYEKDQYRRRDRDYRESSSRSSHRRSRDKRRYEPLYDDYYERKSYDKGREPVFNTRQREQSYRKYRQKSPLLDREKRHSRSSKYREYSRSPSQDRDRRKGYRIEKDQRQRQKQRYQKQRQPKQRYEPRDRKVQQKYLQKSQSLKDENKRRERVPLQ